MIRLAEGRGTDGPAPFAVVAGDIRVAVRLRRLDWTESRRKGVVSIKAAVAKRRLPVELIRFQCQANVVRDTRRIRSTIKSPLELCLPPLTSSSTPISPDERSRPVTVGSGAGGVVPLCNEQPDYRDDPKVATFWKAS